MTTFVFKGSDSVPAAFDYGSFTDELRRLGFPSIIVRLPQADSSTTARAIVQALHDVPGDVVLVGVSHQGLFLPLVAAARPVRRLVYVNALIPRPGRPFIDVLREEPVFAPGLLEAVLESEHGVTPEFIERTLDPRIPVPIRKLLGRAAMGTAEKVPLRGIKETCPLVELPRVDTVYISAEQDQAVRPQWQQEAARKWLGVEPVVIAGARHGTLFRTHPREVAAAMVAGLQPAEPVPPLVTKTLNPSTGEFDTVTEQALFKQFFRKRVRPVQLIYSALPVLLFAAIYQAHLGLLNAVLSAVGLAVATLLWQILRRGPWWPAAIGLFGVMLEGAISWASGSGRGYFLFHIWITAIGAAVLLLSIVLRWPLIGLLISRIQGTGFRWRSDRQVQFYYGLATMVWVVVLAARCAVMVWLYQANAVGWMAIARIVMGHPLGLLALVITIWAVGRARGREQQLR